MKQVFPIHALVMPICSSERRCFLVEVNVGGCSGGKAVQRGTGAAYEKPAFCHSEAEMGRFLGGCHWGLPVDIREGSLAWNRCCMYLRVGHVNLFW